MPTPPSALNPPGPRARRLLSAAWLSLLALVLVGQAGTLHMAAREGAEVIPAFAALGLDAFADDEGRGFTVAPALAAAEAAGVAKGARLLAVDGAPLAPDASHFDVAPLLRGADGGEVRLTLQPPDGAAREVTLVRSAAAADEMDVPGRQTTLYGLHAAFALLALIYLAAAVLLRRRRFGEPVSILLSFAFLGAAASVLGPYAFWTWVGLELFGNVLIAFWVVPLVIALPAFPDGRFDPAWGRWLLVLAPLAALLEVAAVFPTELTDLVIAGLLVAGLAALVIRYRRTPRGPERQQMKWAAGGLVVGIAMLAAAVPLIVAAQWLGEETLAGVLVMALVLLLAIAGLFTVPAGILLSLMRYRLNDADALIGRSAGYAAVTMIVGVVWAVTMGWANRLIDATLGGGPALTTAVSTIAAGLVFLPAKDRVLGWTERRFQPALVRLRALPARLAQWQHGDDPCEVGAAALAEIVEGIGASSAALIGTEGAAPQIYALHGAAAEDAEAPGSAFPLRVPLEDSGGAVAMLLVGPRTDGASYSRDERTAIALIAEPLAQALRATARRSRTAVALTATLVALDERISRLEGLRGASA
ncbi:MAG: hypothetical protein ACK4K7_01105 [Allosphingosinicella sp.]|uniref:hypothetical protein n=1 Tax=Allosphingosinicella sp. TaxID=2823234 RepID=UPI0039620388